LRGTLTQPQSAERSRTRVARRSAAWERLLWRVGFGKIRPHHLLVDLEQGRSLFDLGGFVADVQDLLGCRVDVVSARGLRPRFRDRVLQDAVAL
jgi:hypothetical protein